MKRVMSLVSGLLLCMFLLSAGFAPAIQAADDNAVIQPSADDGRVALVSSSPAGGEYSVAKQSGKAGCPINWKPSVLLPVASISEYFDQSSGAPGPLQVFYPSLGRYADAPITSLLDDCGEYPLVIFLHGNCPGDPNNYLQWNLLPAALARSGYVVVVPKMPGIATGTPPVGTSGDADLAHAKAVLNWMQSGWAYHAAIAPSPAPAIVGHSYGALLGAKLAPQIGASAFVSLSAGWGAFINEAPGILGALNTPSLFAWGSGPSDTDARLDQMAAWYAIKTVKQELVFEQGAHFDYLYADLPCAASRTKGPCSLVPSLAADYTALFLSRYAQPVGTGIEGLIPPSLLPPTVARTPQQANYAAVQFDGLNHLPQAGAACKVTTYLVPPTNPFGFHDTTWPWLDRSASLGAPDGAGWPTVAVIPGLNTYNIAYPASNGHLHELWRNAFGTGTTDLTANAQAPNVDSGSSPFAYVDTNHNKEILLYRDSDGTVHSLYWSTGAVGHDNLSGSAHAPAANIDTIYRANPVGYYDATLDTHHVIYRGEDKHLHELWWHAEERVRYGGDLTELAHAPNAKGQPSAYIDNNGVNMVVYRSQDNHIRSLHWTDEAVVDDDLSGIAHTPIAKGDPVAFYTPHNNTYQIVYVGDDLHVWELSWQGAQPITGRDLTVGLDAPLPDSRLSAYYSATTNTKHVIYSTMAFPWQLHEIQWSSGAGIRAHINISKAYGAPTPEDGPAAYTVQDANSERVTYLGDNGHIYEVFLR